MKAISEPLRSSGQFGVGADQMMNMTIDFKFDQALEDRLFGLELRHGYRWLQQGQEVE